ncbi:hypothetical protein [Nostoc sp.]
MRLSLWLVLLSSLFLHQIAFFNNHQAASCIFRDGLGRLRDRTAIILV